MKPLVTEKLDRAETRELFLYESALEAREKYLNKKENAIRVQLLKQINDLIAIRRSAVLKKDEIKQEINNGIRTEDEVENLLEKLNETIDSIPEEDEIIDKNKIPTVLGFGVDSDFSDIDNSSTLLNERAVAEFLCGGEEWYKIIEHVRGWALGDGDYEYYHFYKYIDGYFFIEESVKLYGQRLVDALKDEKLIEEFEFLPVQKKLYYLNVFQNKLGECQTGREYLYDSINQKIKILNGSPLKLNGEPASIFNDIRIKTIGDQISGINDQLSGLSSSIQLLEFLLKYSTIISDPQLYKNNPAFLIRAKRNVSESIFKAYEFIDEKILDNFSDYIDKTTSLGDWDLDDLLEKYLKEFKKYLIEKKNAYFSLEIDSETGDWVRTPKLDIFNKSLALINCWIFFNTSYEFVTKEDKEFSDYVNLSTALIEMVDSLNSVAEFSYLKPHTIGGKILGRLNIAVSIIGMYTSYKSMYKARYLKGDDSVAFGHGLMFLSCQFSAAYSLTVLYSTAAGITIGSGGWLLGGALVLAVAGTLIIYFTQDTLSRPGSNLFNLEKIGNWVKKINLHIIQATYNSVSFPNLYGK
jgi:hypothetical protein